MGLASAVLTAARRRRDARLFVVALAFLASAGFLGLHALATPGVLLGPNAGFELATPIGLVIGSVLVAVSAVDFTTETARRIMAWARWLLAALVVLMVVWAGVSLAGVPPLDDPLQPESLQGWQTFFAVVGVLGYGAAGVGYLRLYFRRGVGLVLVVAMSFGLLAAMVVIAFAVHWRLSWWEWHVLMLVAFVLIAGAARQEWHEERFSALYLEQTLAGARDVSVLFADLQGFTDYYRGQRTYDIIGDTVNLAARLESQAPVGGVVIGEGTRRGPRMPPWSSRCRRCSSKASATPSPPTSSAGFPRETEVGAQPKPTLRFFQRSGRLVR